MKDEENNGFSNSGQAFEADLDEITRLEDEETEEDD